MKSKIYVIHRNPATGQHYRTAHDIIDKRISHIGTAIHRLGLDDTAVYAVGLRYDDSYTAWANPRLDTDVESGSCASIAMIERDETMRPYMIDARINYSAAEVIKNW